MHVQGASLKNGAAFPKEQAYQLPDHQSAEWRIMFYVIFMGLFFLSFLSVLNMHLNGHLKEKIDVVLGVLFLCLVVTCFWLFGWKWGLGAIAFAWFSAIISALPARALAYKLYDHDWAISKMKLIAKYGPSTLSLLYPIAAAAWISTKPASISEVAGYGIANLGYLLLGAAIFAGTFNIFRLTKRWQVVIAGIIFLIAGTAILNLNIFE